LLSNILVIASKTLDFKPTEGEAVKGTQVHYIMSDLPGTGNVKGFLPGKAFLRGRAAQNVGNVPGVYQGSFKVNTKDGKVQLELVDLDYISEVELATTTNKPVK